ncbi:MAG: ATP-binding protein, partial [Verrucomicrobia bacterium]|nr:ATP-binding protein [Verrucomicrobiota bacterium]
MSQKMNPFPGLRPFEMQEKYLFFGREDQTVELLKRLGQARFLAVVGTSGSGKSSLVRAGLLPELHGGTMTDAGSSWEISVMRPGGDPLTNLARALEDSGIYDTDEDNYYRHLRAMLGRSTMGLIEAVAQSKIKKEDNLLIVVDQFEEIFRFRSDNANHAEEAANFINLLLEASEQTEKSIFVIITMRSDFLGDCSQFRGLAEAVNEGEYLIPRLNRNQRRLAIEGPVKVGGKQIEARLLQQLLNDIGDDPDQLPILQHALMRTWEYHEKGGGQGNLDLEHYEATGGMQEALSRHADEVYDELPTDEDRKYCEKIF